jgi:hypothetical protein
MTDVPSERGTHMRFLSFFSSGGMDDQPVQYLFTSIHFIYIAVCIVLFAVLMRIFLYKSQPTRTLFVNICLILMILFKYLGEAVFVSEWYLFSEPVSSYSHPFWDFRTFFSFQMCGVNNILLPLVIWFKIKPLKDYVFASSILGGIAVMLYPLGILSGDPFVITLPMIRSMVVHLFLVFIPCFLIATGETKIEARNWKRTAVGLLLMAGWAMFGNLFVNWGDNNMYLVDNPFYGGPVPLLNMIPDGYHVILLTVMVTIGFMIVYRIIRIFDGISRRRLRHLSPL